MIETFALSCRGKVAAAPVAGAGAGLRTLVLKDRIATGGPGPLPEVVE